MILVTGTIVECLVWWGLCLLFSLRGNSTRSRTMKGLMRIVAMALALISCAAAFEIRGTIFLGEAEKVAPYRILLNGGEQVAYARTNGEFIFRDVAPGRYVVDIPSTEYLFSQYKIDVAHDGVIRAIEYQYPGAPKARAEYPLAVEPSAELEYFEEREKFSILQLIMNPSFLTVILPIGMLYLLPKLSEAMMDPEEFKKAQEELGTQDPSSIISGMFGGGQQRGGDSDSD